MRAAGVVVPEEALREEERPLAAALAAARAAGVAVPEEVRREEERPPTVARAVGVVGVVAVVAVVALEAEGPEEVVGAATGEWVVGEPWSVASGSRWSQGVGGCRGVPSPSRLRSGKRASSGPSPRAA